MQTLLLKIRTNGKRIKKYWIIRKNVYFYALYIFKTNEKTEAFNEQAKYLNLEMMVGIAKGSRGQTKRVGPKPACDYWHSTRSWRV